MRRFLFLTVCFTATCAFAQTAQTDVFKRFERRITPCEVKTPVQMKAEKLLTPGEKAIRKLEKKVQEMPVTNGKFYADWSKADVLKLNMAEAEAQGKEKMDSVVRTSPAGDRISKQVFIYTATGMGQHCDNYVPDNVTGEWTKSGYYDYQYDDLGRTISITSRDDTGTGDNMMYEFIYTDDTPYYTTQIYYTYDNGEWIPAQKADYTFDGHHNTIDEIYSLYSADEADWTPAERQTAAYDAQNRMTEYYKYVWDGSGDWVGSTSTATNAQKFEYDEEGRSKAVTTLEWVDGAWQNYYQYAYTYDGNGNLTLYEINYWNKEKQDWSGGYVKTNKWGNTYVEYNVRAEYTYDEKNRETKSETFNQKSTGDYSLSAYTTTEYEDLDDGKYNAIMTEYKRLGANGEFEPYSKNEMTINKYGAEERTKSYRYTGAGLAPSSETIKEIDEYNNYHAGYNYGYSANGDGTYTRYASTNEQYTFADDWEPASQLDTPIRGLHQKGVSNTSEEWQDYSVYDFTWEQGDVLAYYIMSYFVNGQPVPTMGRDITYDYQSSTDDIYSWVKFSGSGVSQDYKVLTWDALVNNDYFAGDTEWDNNASYRDTYYYSSVTPTGITRPAATADEAKEVARYNTAGQRVDSSAKGVVIVKYSDGSTKKIINM